MASAQQGPTLAGSFRLFTVAGVVVYMHWSWLIAAWIFWIIRDKTPGSEIWIVAQYLTLFLIVLLHEFGHTFACRQVGGQADEIVLWPLGGIAFVNPPPRPGALLWAIAAGPLVNVVLAPITIGGYFLALSAGWAETNPDALHFLYSIAKMNFVLLFFNILPIYPLDGGQILQALLWFLVGRAKSLLIVCIIGLIVSIVAIVLSLMFNQWWFVVMAGFAAFRSWAGFRQARFLTQLENAPRHWNARCPSCDEHPLRGPFWQCEHCRATFDTFSVNGECPGCGKAFTMVSCPECQRVHPIWAWFGGEGPPPALDLEER